MAREWATSSRRAKFLRHRRDLGLGLQAFVGLPRFAKVMPCKSTVFRNAPACFMASVRSGPGGIARALLSAADASASKSNLVRWSFLSEDMEPNSPARHGTPIKQSTLGCLFGIRHQGQGISQKNPPLGRRAVEIGRPVKISKMAALSGTRHRPNTLFLTVCRSALVDDGHLWTRLSGTLQ
jgi:hypothetical protein